MVLKEMVTKGRKGLREQRREEGKGFITKVQNSLALKGTEEIT